MFNFIKNLFKKKTFIGRIYVPEDNSYLHCVTKDVPGSSVLGTEMVLTSEPYSHEKWGCEMIKAKSLISGLEYEVVWNPAYVVEKMGKLPYKTLIGKSYCVEDGSWSSNINNNNYYDSLYGINMAVGKIVSKPYVKEIKSMEFDTIERLMIDVQIEGVDANRSTMPLKPESIGQIYSVLYMENGVIEDSEQMQEKLLIEPPQNKEQDIAKYIYDPEKENILKDIIIIDYFERL